MLKFLISFLLVFLVSTSVNATVGCIDASGTKIYTDLHSVHGYYKNTTIITSNPGCFFVYTGGVCSIAAANTNNGHLGDTSNPQQCPIDDYAWIMVVLLGGIGYFVVRQRNMRTAIA